MAKPASFSLEERADHYCFSGIPHGGERYTISIAKMPLRDGEGQLRAAWSTAAEAALPDGEFHVGSLALYHNVFRSAYEHRSIRKYRAPLERFQSWAKSTLRSGTYLTLTGINYSAAPADGALFDAIAPAYGFPGEQQRATQLHALNTPELRHNAIERLFEQGAGEVERIYGWILSAGSRVIQIRQPEILLVAPPKSSSASYAISFGATQGKNPQLCVDLQVNPLTTYAALGIRIDPLHTDREAIGEGKALVAVHGASQSRIA